MENAEYVECYIAFLDMLGFKILINQSSCDEIAKIFKEYLDKIPLQGMYLGGKKIINESTTEALKMKVMSDSICLYIEVNQPNALLCMIAVCIMLQYQLFNSTNPIFLRGAIVRGDLYAENDVIFGPGLTQAYLLEENNAKYPRIILTRETLKCMENDNDVNVSILAASIFRDDDAFYTVNYFKMLFDGDKTICEKIKHTIKHFLDTTIDSSIREKYLYLEKKLQQMAMVEKEISLL